MGRTGVRMLGSLMGTRQQREPYWAYAILHWQWTPLAARIALTSAYVLGGFTKLFDFPAAVAEMMRFGLSPRLALGYAFNFGGAWMLGASDLRLFSLARCWL